MKIFIISSFFVLFSQLVFSQENILIVKYSYFNDNSVSKKEESAILKHCNNKSIFIIDTEIFDPKSKYLDENNRVAGDLITSKEEVFKDFNSNRLYSKSPIAGTRKLVLKDSLNLFNWEIRGNDKKNILGYECIEAITTFRGRKYIAYFTEQLAFFDGPWKMSGLPGLILELKEESGKLEIKAFEIQIENNITIVETKLDINNSYYWDELIEKANLKTLEINNKLQEASPGSSFTIDLSNSLELYELKM